MSLTHSKYSSEKNGSFSFKATSIAQEISGRGEWMDGHVGEKSLQFSAVPLYYQVQERLREEIISGVYQKRIPPEKELEKKFCVSRITIRKAVEGLVLEGLLVKKQGIGTLIAPNKVEDNSNILVGFTEKMEKQGIQVTTEVIDVQSMLNEEKAHILQVDPSEEIYMVKRLRKINDVPLGIATVYFPASHGISLEADFSGSMFKLYEQHQLNPCVSQRTIYAVNMNKVDAKFIGVKAGSAALLIHYLTRDKAGFIIEFAEGLWRGDEYSYAVTVTREEES